MGPLFYDGMQDTFHLCAVISDIHMAFQRNVVLVLLSRILLLLLPKETCTFSLSHCLNTHMFMLACLPAEFSHGSRRNPIVQKLDKSARDHLHLHTLVIAKYVENWASCVNNFALCHPGNFLGVFLKHCEAGLQKNEGETEPLCKEECALCTQGSNCKTASKSKDHLCAQLGQLNMEDVN